jgi:peptide deformylase
MLLKITDLPPDTKLVKILLADKIKSKSSWIDGFPGENGSIVKKNSGTLPVPSPVPSQAMVNACWRMVKACLHDDGIGLAAPQIGIMKRMFIIREPNKEEFKVYFHPKYTMDINSVMELGAEGCLSVPGKTLMVSRASVICATWQEFLFSEDEGLIWVERTELLEGMRARVFQHELDHLNGVSILDKGKPVTTDLWSLKRTT